MNILKGISNIKRFAIFTTMLSMFLMGCMPAPPIDDNSHVTFVKEMVPKVLGRKAAGVDEIEVLADISSLLGRKSTIRAVMEQGDFVDHWTDVIVDHLQVQRDGVFSVSRMQPSSCFGDPLRVDGSGDPISDGGALAEFIRDNVATSGAPGGNFNMVDVIRSALELDDLFPIYRAYAFVLNARQGSGTSAQRRANVGGAFNHIYLNHSIGCLSCHNSSFSTSNSPDWQRTHSIPLALETAVYGSISGNLDQNYGFFGSVGNGTPWSMSNCGSINGNGPAGVATTFAGLSGNSIGLLDIDAQFKSGYDSTKLNGITRISNSPNLPNIAGDEGYAFMVAAKITENVWQEIVGEKLTIANYYARNKDQMNAHWNLTEFGLIPSSWSLKELIVRTMDTRFYNRKAPSQSGGCDPHAGTAATPYCLQMIIDPWVERNPSLPISSDPKVYRNGQGELVHRYSPRTLLNSVAEALDWPKPKRYPNTNYPSEALVTSIGQYRSDAKQGTKGIDFQGLLNWETQYGVCAKPAGVGVDWVDRLVSSVGSFDSANPASPLTVQDVVITMKDWLIQEQHIDPLTPTDIDPATNEQIAISALFGVSLNTQLSSVPNFAQKLRSYCGVLLQTPDFMLAGIREDNTLTLPRQRVCNAGEPCSYSEFCSNYSASLSDLGQAVGCFGRTVSHAITSVSLAGTTSVLKKVCLNGDCGFIRAPSVLACHKRPSQCQLPDIPPPCDPRWCDPAPIDINQPQIVLINADDAIVSATKGTMIIRRNSGKRVLLKQKEKLSKGDILSLPVRGSLKIGTDKTLFETPKNGMFSIEELRTRKIDLNLLSAVEAGKLKQVNELVKKGANVNSSDTYGVSALMYSIKENNTKMTNVLIELGADINRKDNRGLRAVEYAQLQKNKEAINLLQKQGTILDLKLLEKGRETKPLERQWLLVVTGPQEEKIKPSKKGEVMSTREAILLSQTGKLRTQNKDIKEIKEIRKKTKYHNRGEAGRLPTPEEAKKALQEYMETTFKLEHGMTGKDQRKKDK